MTPAGMLTGGSLGRSPTARRVALGSAIATALIPLLLAAAFASLFAALLGQGALPTQDTQIGPSSPIPGGLVAVFNDAAQVLDVNPYLLASIAEQESGMGQGSGWQGVNCCGAAGFMQIGVGGAASDNWDRSVSLRVGGTSRTFALKDAFTLGSRPATYALQTSAHPSYDDPYDAVMAAAVLLRAGEDGRALPALDASAQDAACVYNAGPGRACSTYAAEVISRARQWQAQSALVTAIDPTGLPTINVPPGSRLAQLVSIADQIAALRLPYCWGGGHASAPGPSHGTYCHDTANNHIIGSLDLGLDCSGAIRWLLVSAGYRDPGGITSGEMGSWLVPGPGQAVTVYYNAGHTWALIAGRAWGTSDGNYRGGAGWIAAPPAASQYAAAHPEGL
jgi:hypothetical protein